MLVAKTRTLPSQGGGDLAVLAEAESAGPRETTGCRQAQHVCVEDSQAVLPQCLCIKWRF